MSRLPGWLWGTGRRRATNRSRDEPAHPHPAPGEEVPARAPTLGQPRTCARTDRPWEQPVLSLRTTASTSRAQGPYNPPVLAGVISSHVKTASEDRLGPAHAAQAAEGGGGKGAGNRGGPWVQIPTLLPPGRVTSDKSPNLSEFRFLHLSNNNSSTYHQGRWGIRETVRGEQTANYDRSTSV